MVQPATGMTVYEQFDKLDDAQIMNADTATRQALVYRMRQNINGKVVVKENLTFAGFKWLSIRMAEIGQHLDAAHPEIEVVKPDEKAPYTWYYRVLVDVTNRKTGHKTWGHATEPYMAGGKWDSMAERRCSSKAERNGLHKQIPEPLIQSMLEESHWTPDGTEVDRPGEPVPAESTVVSESPGDGGSAGLPAQDAAPRKLTPEEAKAKKEEDARKFAEMQKAKEAQEAAEETASPASPAAPASDAGKEKKHPARVLREALDAVEKCVCSIPQPGAPAAPEGEPLALFKRCKDCSYVIA